MGIFDIFGGSSSNSSWQEHVQNVQQANPGMPLKKVLRLAKKTYRRQK